MNRSKTAIMQLPPVVWKTDTWTTPEPPGQSSLKEQLLYQSLQLIKDERENEEAIREIIEQALEHRLYNVAFQAVKYFASDSAFHMCV